MVSSVLELLQAEAIKKLSFKDFMQQALYAPEVGYYTNPRLPIGNKGDFITAPTIGSLFAHCVSNQINEIFKHIGTRNFIEYGAGTGHLAADLGKLVDFACYIIIEISPQLRQQQYLYIEKHNPDLLAKIQWLTEPPANFHGVIFANEVLDAFPVHKFHFHHGKLQEFYVEFNNPKLTWSLEKPSESLSREFYRQELDILLAGQEDYVSEINPAIGPWLNNIAQKLAHGVVLICDYGFDRQEYYHPMRNMGTLMAHYQHRVSSDLLNLPGAQDITAHVDFTTIAEASLANDLNLLGYTNLASFLLNCNILEAYSKTQRLDEFNLLTSASELGELFKVIALGTSSITYDLAGFKAFDYSHKL